MVKNDLEVLFDLSYNSVWKSQFLCIKEVDFPLYLIQQSKLRFKPHQIVDRVLLSHKKNFAFELKHSKTSSIALDRIKPHQIKFLNDFEQFCGSGFFIFSFEGLKYIFLINIHQYLKIIQHIEKKSINMSDLQANPTILKISQIKINAHRQKKVLNLSSILFPDQNRIENFLNLNAQEIDR